MKCINCGTDNNLKDRTSNYGRCKQCQHPFVFEPTSADNKSKITDQFFKKLLDDISVGGTIAYTSKQLHYFLDRRVKNKSNVTWLGSLVIYLLLGGFLGVWFTMILGGRVLHDFSLSFILSFTIINIIAILMLSRSAKDINISPNSRKQSNKILGYFGWILLLVGTVVSWIAASNLPATSLVAISGITAIALSKKQTVKPGYLTENFIVERSLITQGKAKWVTANGEIDKLLPAPHQVAISGVKDEDVTAYSFDRLIVTDSDSIAHFLIANNFHFENNCAILSINEYPKPIFDTVMEMVLRNPNLQVYALHDCSPEGVSLIHQLSTSDRWFADRTTQTIDLGLLPRQVIAAETNLFIQQSKASELASQRLIDAVRQSLTSAELVWLDAGNFVELESFPPRRLLQIIHQGINRSRDLATADDGGGMILVDNYGSDRAAIYPVDSFG